MYFLEVNNSIETPRLSKVPPVAWQDKALAWLPRSFGRKTMLLLIAEFLQVLNGMYYGQIQ